MMRSKSGLVVAFGLGTLAVWLARSRVDGAGPQPIKVHDRIIVIVEEQFRPKAIPESSRRPSSSVTEKGFVTYRVAGMVVDMLPDGTLLLEARKSTLGDKGLTKYTLTGRIRSADLLPDRTVRSEQISDLSITKVFHKRPQDSSTWAQFTRWCRSPFPDARSVEAPNEQAQHERSGGT